MRVAIIDDSRLARLELKEQLAQLQNIEIVAEAASVEAALLVLKNESIDLLLLDIDLPDGNGFGLLEQLAVVPQVIFVTAFNEFAVKSFEYNALDYLLKPVRLERLQVAISKCKQDVLKTLSPENRIFIKDREKCYFVSVDEIVALEAMGNYTKVHIKDAQPSVYRPIGAIYERLDTNVFFRASRSWVINTNFVEQIEALENGTFLLTLSNNKKVNISKRQVTEFKRTWTL